MTVRSQSRRTKQGRWNAWLLNKGKKQDSKRKEDQGRRRKEDQGRRRKEDQGRRREVEERGGGERRARR
eukprot:761706-Hanusia_phi.AAC.3